MNFLADLLAKYAMQILTALAIVALYFYWAHGQQAIGRAEAEAIQAKKDARIAEQSEKLMAAEKANADLANKQKLERAQNATNILADRLATRDADVARLTARMQRNSKAATCSKDSMSRGGDNNSEGKGQDNESNQRLAGAIVDLANLCEKKIEELPVVN